MALLEMRNVHKTYGSTHALSDITLSIEEGQFVSIIGPWGAGKATLLRCVNRLVDATQGAIVLDGQDITKVRGSELRHIRTKTGMIFQNYNLVNRLSVIENVLHGRLGHKSTLSGAADWYTEREKERAFQLLDKLGLTDQAYKRCDELSGGQKQRVGIARALMQGAQAHPVRRADCLAGPKLRPRHHGYRVGHQPHHETSAEAPYFLGLLAHLRLS